MFCGYEWLLAITWIGPQSLCINSKSFLGIEGRSLGMPPKVLEWKQEYRITLGMPPKVLEWKQEYQSNQKKLVLFVCIFCL